MKVLKWSIFLVSLLLLCACIPLRYTLEEIKTDPITYSQEAEKVCDALPVPVDSNLPIGVVVGYALSFLRRLYVNWRKLKNNGG